MGSGAQEGVGDLVSAAPPSQEVAHGGRAATLFTSCRCSAADLAIAHRASARVGSPAAFFSLAARTHYVQLRRRPRRAHSLLPPHETLRVPTAAAAQVSAGGARPRRTSDGGGCFGRVAPPGCRAFAAARPTINARGVLTARSLVQDRILAAGGARGWFSAGGGARRRPPAHRHAHAACPRSEHAPRLLLLLLLLPTTRPCPPSAAAPGASWLSAPWLA